VSEGKVTRLADDARGRATLPWDDVVQEILLDLCADDWGLVFDADAGDPNAQNDLGQLFLAAGHYKQALYWLHQSADKQNADAMHWLGYCHVGGKGVPVDHTLGLMWLAKSASHGHAIAKEQINQLVQKGVSRLP
jgi:uncharacterized protein